MNMQSCFLRYVESHKDANAIKSVYGTDSYRTRDAYERVNTYKRKMLDLIEDNEALLSELNK